MKFNINDKVYVKMLPRGRFIHEEYYQSLQAIVPEITIPNIVEDADGWSEWRLWDLMNIFGRHIYNGCDMPFETTILIPNEQRQTL